jgi:hypothetical protein
VELIAAPGRLRAAPPRVLPVPGLALAGGPVRRPAWPILARLRPPPLRRHVVHRGRLVVVLRLLLRLGAIRRAGPGELDVSLPGAPRLDERKLLRGEVQRRRSPLAPRPALDWAGEAARR